MWNHRWQQKQCWILLFLLMFSWGGFPEYAIYAQEASKAQEDDEKNTAEKMQKVAGRIEKMAPGLQAAMQELSRDTFDFKVIVEQVGREPKKLCAWVRSNTFLVPYQGSLRGPKGVLMDRLGNSLDRALLLAQLLKLSGHTVRLVRTLLVDTQAEELLQEMNRSAQNFLSLPLFTTPQAVDSNIEKYAKLYQIEPTLLRQHLTKTTLHNQRLAEEAAERVTEQTQLIVEALGTQTETTDHDKNSVAALQDHWWVQYADGKKWLDLDPTLASAERKAQNIVAFAKKGELRLDSKFCHEVAMSVVIEQWQEGRLRVRPVLSQTLRPAELFGERIKLSCSPLDWPKDLNIFQEPQALEKLKAMAAAQHEWLPVLTVGAKNISHSAFTDAGDVKDKRSRHPAEGLGDKLGGLFGGPKQKKQGYLTAAWIEYKIQSPGKPVQTIRRDIFDLLGPALRAAKKIPEPTITDTQRLDRGLALLGEIDILILCAQLSSDFVKYLALETVLANQKTLPDIVRCGLPKTSEEVKQLGKLKRLPGALYNLAMVRSAWSRFQNDIYLDTPNILTFFSYMGSSKENGIRLHRGFDIVANEVAVRPGAKVDPFLARIQQGIVDTNAEVLLMQNAANIENTAEIFMKSSSQGSKWLTIRSISDPAWQNTELSQDIRSRIGQDLASGYIVLVPQKPLLLEGKPLTGWWRIDPTNGHLLGFMESGRGQAMTEYSIMDHFLAFGPGYFGFFMGWLGCAGFKDPRNNTTAKNLTCFMCALITAVCFELMWIGKLAEPIPIAQCGLFVTGLGISSCGIGGAL
jgi:hypothetical protein